LAEFGTWASYLTAKDAKDAKIAKNLGQRTTDSWVFDVGFLFALFACSAVDSELREVRRSGLADDTTHHSSVTTYSHPGDNA